MPKDSDERQRPAPRQRRSAKSGRQLPKVVIGQLKQPSATEVIAVWRAFLRDEIDAILYS